MFLIGWCTDISNQLDGMCTTAVSLLVDIKRLLLFQEGLPDLEVYDDINHSEREDNLNGKISCVLASEAECDRERYIRVAGDCHFNWRGHQEHLFQSGTSNGTKKDIPDRGRLTFFFVPSQIRSI